MTDKLWKQVERRIAKKLNGKRNPLSGRNSGNGTSSDVLHPDLYIEVKHRQRIPFQKVFHETVKKGREENKIPVLILHQKSSRENIVMMADDDFADLIMRAYGKEDVPGEGVR